MINPYSGIDLQSVERVWSVSHQHLSHSSQSAAQSAYNTIYSTGVRHFPVVQYRPSLVPAYSYADNVLKYTAKPIPSDATIADIKADCQYDVTIDNDAICGPNAEHVYPYLYLDNAWYKWTNVHINGLGSEFESGLVRVDGSFSDAGLLCPYSEGITNILTRLKYPDGGGVIINHPKWTVDNTHKSFDMARFIEDCLDYDERVLGTDIIESGIQTRLDYDITLADTILSTGRRCWLFCQGDWNQTRGRNELLIPAGLSRAEQEYACLKAYRDGAFFGRYANSDLSITSIGFSNGTFTLTAANADGIKVYIDGTETDYTGTSVSVTVPSSAKYVRAMAYINRDDDPDWTYDEGDVYKDLVFTNPIMVNERTYKYDPAYDVVKTQTDSFPVWFWG